MAVHHHISREEILAAIAPFVSAKIIKAGPYELVCGWPPTYERTNPECLSVSDLHKSHLRLQMLAERLKATGED